MNQGPLQGAVRLALAVASTLLVPFGAYAQDAPRPTTTLQQDEIEEIIVTGTRLPDPNLGSTSPVQVVDAEAIKISGRTDLSDALQLLPQITNNSLGQGLGNRTSGLTTAGGVSNLDLRGLGPNRTLVMVNGRRMGAGSPNTAIQSPSPNPDQIPTGLVERIDVVTGGASAVYGSDAIAGVVNFILKRDFEGLELDGSYGVNWHDNDNGFAQQIARDFGVDPETGTETDGGYRNFSILGGLNSPDGRANFTVFLGYQDQDPVRSGQRDYGACQLNKDTDDNGVPTGTVSCGGSANSNLFLPTAGPFANNFYSVFGNEFVDYGSVETTPPAEFNSQEYIYMGREFERYNAGLIGHYDINDQFKPYVEFTFSNDQTHQEIAPSALFISSNPLTATGNYLINCSNPLLSDQQRNILCTPQQIADDLANPGSTSADVLIGRRNVEGGGRFSEYEHTNYRAVLGTTGDISSAWSYDAYGQYYYTNFYQSNNKYLDFQKITNALQVTTDADGNPACVSGGACVPYNIFADGGVTDEALDYLYLTGTAYGKTRLGTLHVDFTGELGEYGLVLPTASDGVAVNVGYEKRHERVEFAPDAAELSGLLAGFGGASVAINEGVDVAEWFAEAGVPLVQDKPGIYDLNLNAGYRHSQYSTTGGEDTYKFEVQYAPVAGYKLRGSYNRAIRAPSIVELYNPPLVGQIQIGTDPCARTLDDDNNVVPAVASLADCLNTVSPDQAAAFTAAYGNGGTTNTIPQGTADQLSQLQGGNTSLKPEQADTYTFGLTITSELVPNFNGSIDYFRIDLEDIVDVLPATVALNGCPTTGDPVYCGLLSRNPVTFGLNGASVESGGYIIQTNQNIAEARVSGIDIQLSYELDLPSDLGLLNFGLAGTYLIDNETTDFPGSTPYDCAGLFGATCQTVNPDWRHILRTTWETPWDLDVALTWRFTESVDQDNNDDNPVLRFASYDGIDTFNDHIASFSWWDLAATYTALDNLEIRAGINNMFDTDPPYISNDLVSGGAANTYEYYDYFGRQLFVGFTLKL